MAASEPKSYGVVFLAVAVAGLSPALSGGPEVGPPAAGGTSEGVAAGDSVKAVVHAFHDALAAGDSARALELLHPEVRVFESGHAETLSQYRSGHLAADIAFSRAVDRTVLGEHVSVGERRALYLSEYRMSGTFRGEDVEVHGTETMALVRTDAGWRIRHIHWSSR